jgi:hypothetical protein
MGRQPETAGARFARRGGPSAAETFFLLMRSGKNVFSCSLSIH